MNRRHRLAASIAAASYGSRGRLLSPASRMIVNHGVQIQTSVNTTIANAGQRSASQAMGEKPSPSQTAATTPN